MESVSVFDMLKIGVGPSSSHTLGPWKAAQRFINKIEDFNQIIQIKIDLYGSLALTGKGHGTDIAIILGLCGYDPITISIEDVKKIPVKIKENKVLNLNKVKNIFFDFNDNIIYHSNVFLDEHPNGMTIKTLDANDEIITEKTYFSIGGGFITENNTKLPITNNVLLDFPIHKATDLSKHCENNNLKISQIVLRNELRWNNLQTIEKKLLEIWDTMLESIFIGCHAKGILPGGLNVKRRAASFYENLKKEEWNYSNKEEWLKLIQTREISFSDTMKWISCFSLAVNEQNADFGRIVTAPTNGASGVIPSVLMYYLCSSSYENEKDEIIKFLLVAGEIGSIFKKGATISAALGGCQAEIGVSSAMAAAALTECSGGTYKQALMAAEIAMEHHLGLTCDPIGGLVQIPCIERNSMGAIKAIMACNLALGSNPDEAKVSLDQVVETMLETAKDMNHKYKETSTGGLATKVTVNIPEC